MGESERKRTRHMTWPDGIRCESEHVHTCVRPGVFARKFNVSYLFQGISIKMMKKAQSLFHANQLNLRHYQQSNQKTIYT